MAVKLRKIENYDLLEKFTNKSIPAFSVQFDKVLKRTFCKCGKVHVGLLDKCTCGNPVTNKYLYFDLTSEFERFEVESVKDKYGHPDNELLFNLHKINFSYSADSSTFVLDDSIVPLVRASDTYCDILTTSYYRGYGSNDFDKFFGEEIVNYKNFDKVSYWYNICKNFTSNAGAYAMCFDLNTKYKSLFSDKKSLQYPYLTAYLCKLGHVKPGLLASFHNFFKLDEEYLDAVNYSLSIDSDFIHTYEFELVDSYLTGKPLSGGKSLNIEIVGLIKHYLFNHMLTFSSALKLLKAIDGLYYNIDRPRDFPEYKYVDNWMHRRGTPVISDFFKIEYMEFFSVWLKENISLLEDKNLIIINFLDKIKEMHDYNIPITKENFKIKNYNWLFTSEKMAEVYKLPEGKVNLFMDYFEINPLNALELVANRRKLTKKQIDDIIDNLSK